MRNKGFTVTELIIVVALVCIVAAILIPQFSGLRGAATTVKCAANIENFASEVNLMCLDSGVGPTQDQVRDRIGWNDGDKNRYNDYWYLPNNSDFNKGHGNDLDGCDEENPGASSENRECIPMKFVIVCNHDGHSNESDAKYIWKTDFFVHQIVPYNQVPHTYLRDANWWLGKDPGFQKWIGRTPTN
jgi:prepilin-type N-terminal cleavage/methylation domain-containing protein